MAIYDCTTLGQLIVTKREHSSLSQEKLAEILSASFDPENDLVIDANTVGCWERNDRFPQKYKKTVQDWLEISESEWSEFQRIFRKLSRDTLKVNTNLRVADWNDVVSWG